MKNQSAVASPRRALARPSLARRSAPELAEPFHCPQYQSEWCFHRNEFSTKTHPAVNSPCCTKPHPAHPCRITASLSSWCCHRKDPSCEESIRCKQPVPYPSRPVPVVHARPRPGAAWQSNWCFHRTETSEKNQYAVNSPCCTPPDQTWPKLSLPHQLGWLHYNRQIPKQVNICNNECNMFLSKDFP